MIEFFLTVLYILFWKRKNDVARPAGFGRMEGMFKIGWQAGIVRLNI